MYEYRVRPLAVIDGDTIECDVDLGLHVHRIERLRLLGVDTPELNSTGPNQRAAAQAARDFVKRLLIDTTWVDIIVRTEKPYSTDKYGRWLGTFLFRNSPLDNYRNLSQELIATGLAVAYDGGKRTP